MERKILAAIILAGYPTPPDDEKALKKALTLADSLIWLVDNTEASVDEEVNVPNPT